MKLSPIQLRRLRLHSQYLIHNSQSEASDPVQVLNRVIAVQAQETAAAILSLWARSDGFTAATVREAQKDDHTIIRAWLMRGTLHLVLAKDFGWLLPLLGPRFIHKTRRRYEDLGLVQSTRRTSLSVIQDILSGQGPMSRSELIRRLSERGLPTAGQAGYHLLHYGALSGLICFGPEENGEETLVLLKEWAQTGQKLTQEEAQVELARRYLKAYAPAGPEDLAAWSGLTVSSARAAFKALAGQLVEVNFEGQPLWMLVDQAPWLERGLAEGMNVKLLPRYDTYLLGYRNRDLTVPQEFMKEVHPGGGILHPVVLVNGLAAGTWKTKRHKDGMQVIVKPFRPLAQETAVNLEDEVQSLAHFLAIEWFLELLPSIK